MLAIRDIADLELRQIPVDDANIDLCDELAAGFVECSQEEASARCPVDGKLARHDLGIFLILDRHQRVASLEPLQMGTVSLADCITQRAIAGLVAAQIQPITLQL
jgi:hypothetical protein